MAHDGVTVIKPGQTYGQHHHRIDITQTMRVYAAIDDMRALLLFLDAVVFQRSHGNDSVPRPAYSR
jgi:hypothetical protein